MLVRLKSGNKAGLSNSREKAGARANGFLSGAGGRSWERKRGGLPASPTAALCTAWEPAPLVPGGLGSGPHRTQGDRGGHPLPRHRVAVPAATDRGWTECMGTGTSAQGQGGGDVPRRGAWPGLALCEGRQALPPRWVNWNTDPKATQKAVRVPPLPWSLSGAQRGGRMSGRACHTRPAPRQEG